MISININSSLFSYKSTLMSYHVIAKHSTMFDNKVFVCLQGVYSMFWLPIRISITSRMRRLKHSPENSHSMDTISKR